MSKGRSGSSVQKKLGFLIFGAKGTWKSSLALQLAKFKREDGKHFRVLYIDAENGSIDYYLEDYEKEGIDTRNVYIVYTQSLSEVLDFIKKVKNNEDFYDFDEDGNETDNVYLDSDGKPFRPDAIVIDGLTILYIARQQGIIEFSKKRATVRAKNKEITGMEKEVMIEGSGLEMKDWNTLNFNGHDLILSLMATGKHYVVTCRETTEKEQIKDKSGEIKYATTGNMIPEGFKGIGYNVNTVIHMFQDDDGLIKGIIDAKDRTKVHQQGEILIEPTLLDWQVVIDSNKGKKNYIIANTLNESVEAERKAIEKDNAKYEDEFEEEGISQNSSNTFTTAEEYQTAISNIVTKLNPTKKAKVQAAITEAGLPKAYPKIADVDILKKYLSIVISIVNGK